MTHFHLRLHVARHARHLRLHVARRNAHQVASEQAWEAVEALEASQPTIPDGAPDEAYGTAEDHRKYLDEYERLTRTAQRYDARVADEDEAIALYIGRALLDFAAQAPRLSRLPNIIGPDTVALLRIATDRSTVIEPVHDETVDENDDEEDEAREAQDDDERLGSVEAESAEEDP